MYVHPHTVLVVSILQQLSHLVPVSDDAVNDFINNTNFNIMSVKHLEMPDGDVKRADIDGLEILNYPLATDSNVLCGGCIRILFLLPRLIKLCAVRLYARFVLISL